MKLPPLSRVSSVKQIFIDLLIILIVALIPLLWLPEGQILTGHDSGYPINVLEAYKNRFFTWNSQDSMGLDNATSISVIPVLSIQAAAVALGATVAQSEEITFIFWFFLMQVSMYFLAYSLRENIPYRWFPLLAALLYVFNFYLLALWRYGAGTTFSAYTALPLALAFSLGMLQGRIGVIRAGIYVSLTLFIFNGGGGLSVPLFGGLLLSLFWVFTYFFLLLPKGSGVAFFKKMGIFVCVTFIVSFVLNAYWLVPFLYFVITTYYTTLQAVGGKIVVLKWTESVSTNTSISNLFRLQGYPDWYNNPFHPYANSFLLKAPLIFISMLFAPAAYTALVVAKEIEQRKLVIFFAVLSLLGVFFAAGTHPPTGWLYSLFILYVPGFVVFRSAQYKFIPALLAAFAILIAYSVNYLLFETRFLDYFGKRKNILATTGVACFAALLVIYHYPFFQRGFFFYNKSLSTLITIPEYVNSFDKWSKVNFDDEGRTMILPRFNSSWKAGLFDWNYFSLYSPFNLITPKPFVQYSYYLNESQFALFNRAALELSNSTPLADRLLKFFQVRHVLLAKDIRYTSEDIPSEPWNRYENALGQQKFPLVWNEGAWQVFKNPGYQRNKIYAVNQLTEFRGTGDKTIGAILSGADDFVMPQILGKSGQNPELSQDSKSNTVYGINCVSCGLYGETREIIPPYTNVLPGSFFYGLKRWREIKPVDLSFPLQPGVSDRLGLSLKRISEIASLAEKGSDTQTVKESGQELYDLWTEIAQVMPDEVVTSDDVDVLTLINNYATSQDKVFRKLLGAHAQYTDSLKPVATLLKEIVSRVDTIKDRNRNDLVFVSPVSLTDALFYLDEASLPVDQDRKLVYPTDIQVNDKYQKIAIRTDGGKADLGRYTTSEKAAIRLKFPELDSQLGSTTTTTATLDNIVQTCQAASISGYSPDRNYEVILTNADKMPKTAQIYLRKKKNSSVQFSVTDRVFKPDYAFNFDRENTGRQRLYFAGSDGDVNAYIYLCVPKGEEQMDYEDTLSVHEMIKPALFIQEGKPPSFENRQKIHYKMVNQTKYIIDLSQASFPLTLVFNENYNMLWRLSEVDSTGNFRQVLTSWSIPSYSQNGHMQVNGFANGWYLKEKPKSGKLILEFYPQSLFYKGIVLTVVGFIGVVIYFVVKRKLL